MVKIEKWGIHGVIPGKHEVYGDWIVQTSDGIVDSFGKALMYHDHSTEEERILYTVTSEDKCRECGELAPPGVRFRAKTYTLRDPELNRLVMRFF